TYAYLLLHYAPSFPTRRSSDLKIFGGSTETDLDITRIWYPSYGFFGRRGILIGYYTIGAAKDPFTELSHRERHRRALTQGKKIRSEEHTSELQSRENLVCRLLL